jgi:hypothetical protein
MGALEEGGKALGSIVDAMKSSPLALALILVNLVFIVFTTYILHELAENQRIRMAAQEKILTQLIRDCTSGRKPEEQSMLRLPPVPTIPITKEATK